MNVVYCYILTAVLAALVVWLFTRAYYRGRLQQEGERQAVLLQAASGGCPGCGRRGGASA
ncbi:hypothetical protein ACWED2_04760 [Amycolatopsis sp. NPDC005003]